MFDKKEILRVRTVSNTGIYCSSDRVGAVYNKCSKIPPSTSMHLLIQTLDCGAHCKETVATVSFEMLVCLVGEINTQSEAQMLLQC